MRLLLFIIVLMSTVTVAIAQAPLSMSYQAVIRDGSGNLIVNQNVGVRFQVLQGSQFGAAVFVETHTGMTNSNGLLTLEIGTGTIVSGSLNIDWGSGVYFLKMESDPAGGTSYSIANTNQILSVPYALYAQSAGKVDSLNALSDSDKDTWVKVEENPDEDIIRFYLGGTEKWAMKGNSLEPQNVGWSVFIGRDAGANDDLSTNTNTYIGNGTGFSNVSGSNNSAYGAGALADNQIGHENTAIGIRALQNYASGDNNTAIGAKALMGSSFNSNTGTGNTAVGYSSLFYNSTGTYNCALGDQALYTNTVGYGNLAAGGSSAYNNTAGYHNVALGDQTLYNNTTGFHNTAVGFAAGFNGTSFSNSTAIGHLAPITASNEVKIGDINVGSIGGIVGWTTFSDGRFKQNVEEKVPGLDFIKALRPVIYNLNIDKLNKFYAIPDSFLNQSHAIESMRAQEARVQSGFIAQEVEEAANKLGYKFSGVDVPANDKDPYGLRYSEFVVPMVKAMQEQQVIIEGQAGVIEGLKVQNKDLEIRLKKLENLVRKLESK